MGEDYFVFPLFGESKASAFADQVLFHCQEDFQEKDTKSKKKTSEKISTETGGTVIAVA